ncbi:NUDIX hydrolase [Candidatus Nitrosocosmicus franklandus]|uniref:ADP-ribose pyrophosphatase n=1 Tax=Candidatus Nitrosocosmicus franklandianus TaxID=1798806 RepID=A0A484IAT5_9ARCH|nr:NUDIX hydrolase [Candidatus Nitrosocosmicus franklandus]VFJ13327.1 ADP-ribose pyrophosphatase [Candidatus Nitrosocosmicus franklandus]
MSEEGYNIINRKIIHDGPVKLRIDSFVFRGKTFEKEVVEHSPSVGIIPKISEEEILLIRQFRHAVNRYLIEIPAGKIEHNELPHEAAKRELAEETGYSGILQPLTKCFLAPSYDTELMHFFIACDLTKLKQSSNMDEDENITTMNVKIKDAIKYCYDGTITDCKTVSAILLYYLILSGEHKIINNN